MTSDLIYKDLFPFQIEGVDFLTKPRNNPNIALWDEQGTGKTLQTIRACDKLKARRLLILCPAVARINWGREITRWGTVERKVHVVKSTTGKIPDDADALVIGQDMIANQVLYQKLTELERFDVLIVDEAHAYKNRTALRTKALYGPRLNGAGGLIALAGRTILLTGTPSPNNSSELFTHLRALAPERLETENGRLTYAQFLNRFCHVEIKNYGMQSVVKVHGNKNNVELRNRLEGFYIRRKKQDVLKDLPPLIFGTVVLEPPRDAIRELKNVEQGKQIDEVKVALAAAAAAHFNNDDRASEEILALANKSAIASLRRVVGLAKVKPTAEFVKNELENGTPKIILFAYHKEVISQMFKELTEYNPVVLTGETSKTARQNAIDSFQTDKNIRVFIGQIDACNAAITLTASDAVIIMEPSFVPAINAQAAARAHRIGQKNCVNARFVVLAGSLDEMITRILVRKAKQIADVIY